MSTTRLALESLAVGAVFFALTAARLPEVVADPTHAFWGRADADAIEIAWTLWHVARHVVREGTLGVHTQLISFPEGGRIWPMTPVEAVLLVPVTLRFGAVAVFNLLQILHVGLAAGATYALCRRLAGSALAAAAAAPVVALSPVLLATAHNGNAEVGQVFWVPLGGLLAWQVGRGGRSSRAQVGVVVLAALVLAAALLGNIYVGISTGLVAGGLLITTRSEADTRSWTLSALAVYGLAGAITAPILLYAASLSTGAGALVFKAPDVVLHMRLMEGAASLWGFVAPGVVHALNANGGPGPFLNGWATGWIAGALALVSLRHPNRLRVPLVVLAVISVFLALGPVLKPGTAPLEVGGHFVPLPFVFLDLVPPFNMLIELWRFSMVLQVAVALLVALQLARGRSVLAALAGLAIVAEAILLTPGPDPWTVDRVPDEPLAELTRDLPEGPVLHLPARQFQWPLYFQTVHGQAVANSPLSTTDPRLLGVVAPAGWSMADLHEVATGLGYRWLILHLREEMRSLQPIDDISGDLREAGLVTREEGSLLLVDFTQPGPWPSRAYSGSPPPPSDVRGSITDRIERGEEPSPEPAGEP